MSDNPLHIELNMIKFTILNVYLHKYLHCIPVINIVHVVDLFEKIQK